MKLKLLREHYQSNTRQIWTPKKAFESREEIKEAGFYAGKWDIYRCTFCKKLHVAKVKKDNTDDF